MTEESKQIVERLRKEQEGASRDPYGPVDADLYGEAADHIEKLEKEKADAERRGFERCREMAARAIQPFCEGQHECCSEYEAFQLAQNTVWSLKALAVHRTRLPNTKDRGEEQDDG